MSDLRCLAHEGPPAHPTPPGRRDRAAVWPWWRASGDRGESPAQAATHHLAPCSTAGAESDAERPAAVRILVDLPQSRTHSKGCHRARPSTLLALPQALVRSRYRRLFSSTPRPKKPGPTGPSTALIQAIVELKSRNPRFGCPRIARIISHKFRVNIDNNAGHRVLEKHYRPAPGGPGPSWLSFIGHRQTVCGAWTSFAASPSCSGATGSSRSSTSSRVALSASACIVAPPRAPASP